MFSELIKTKLSNIKCVVFDIDGTLTDGAMYYSANGEELKRFHVRDGMGIVLLKKSGIKIAFLTSENSPIVEARAKKLQIDKIILGSRDKTKDLKKITEEFKLNLDEIAYCGDDINDLHAMKLAGFSFCPLDSSDAIKSISNVISKYNGGNGVARELAEIILSSQNLPILLEENW